ncbi:hypothetical protein EH138_17795 [Salmonella enterica subsp. enterica serovar Eastbourne]|uniref:Uncharacterized protein n=1 Tax=Salmonella enterica subsp. enterica serovar Eastbourne TaxID=486993 RepID=A0A702B958_SALET|nr:hypothetical protein [Salmonella enterica subsp. enterica serovar Eastbourne]ECW0821167.1 hypothetical protein [Salmonella enterica subsp. enterica]ECA1897622.1 hypothetical protein [Salmonella enterica subsp. enterica serovar Eastbourne]HAC6678306.1 hypothetical protein [Salmonella enterica subsp. enterica serovar Eastbourne]HAE5115785.1 hypothetical protein [Salmonella enterica subsp. enterica serovar Eastbourne]
MPSNLFISTPTDLYVLLYSESQKCFHIETVAAMVDKNVRMYLNGKSGDYVPLAFGATVEELREIRHQLVGKRGDTDVPRYLYLVDPDE